MDILDPFPQAPSQLKFLISAGYYFKKWVEAEALYKITTTNVLMFLEKNIQARFRIPQAIVADDITQFIDKNMKTLLEDLKVKQHFKLVEHPQTNGQAQAVNQVLLRGLKRMWQTCEGNREDKLPHVLWKHLITLF